MRRTHSAALVCGLVLAAGTPGVAQARALDGTAGPTVRVTLTEFKVKMSTRALKAGTTITFVVKNSGHTTHEAVLERAGCARQCAVVIGGHKAEVEGIKAGATKTVRWKITKPGAYAITCRIPGHYRSGMHVNFTVTK